MTRFLIEIDAASLATITCPADAAWSRTRQLLRDPDTFPLPPAADMPAAGEIEFAICTDAAQRRDTRKRIISRQPQGDDMFAFGRYLWRTLLGPQLWAEILQLADASSGKTRFFDSRSRGRPVSKPCIGSIGR